MFKFCPNCGMKNEGWKICPECGTPLERSQPESAGEVSGSVEDLSALARAAVLEKQRQLEREQQEEALERVKKMLSVFEYDEHVDGTFTITKLKDRSAPVITVPEKVVGIADGAFEGCDRLRKVILPEGLLDIGANAFRGCTRLMEIVLPKSLLAIEAGAFQGCSLLTEVLFPQDANPLIEETAFEEACICGHSREEIEQIRAEEAARKKREEEEARLRAEEEAHKQRAEEEARQKREEEEARLRAEEEARQKREEEKKWKKFLAESEIADGVLYKYKGDRKIVEIPNRVKEIGDGAFRGCSHVTQITIPNSVTKIENNAFEGCSSLKQITIPESVTSIGVSVFENCSGLTEIKVDPKNQTYHAQGNCLIETKSKTLISGCNTSFIPVDGSVTSIGDYAFCGCSGWYMDITIPNGVIKIGLGAFRGCSRLMQITIPNSVTEIGGWAFEGCSQLTICCRAQEQPYGWDYNWNPDNRLVVWGYTGY